MLLSFSVANFRCFTEEATLSLLRPNLKTLTPRQERSWEDSTFRLAAAYGANASGKSTLLAAIEALQDALSGTRGGLSQPNALDPACAARPTTYSVEFTHEQERYQYTVEAQPWGISREELWAAASSRWRKVFVRTQASKEETLSLEPGASLTGATAEVRRITTQEDLFLAVALRYRHTSLTPVARSLGAVTVIHHEDQERDARLNWLLTRLVRKPEWWSDVSETIVQMADLGISRVEIEEQDVPPEMMEMLHQVFSSDDSAQVEIPENLLLALQHSLVFLHRDTSGQERRLGLRAQSQGTLTWLATVGPVIESLRRGNTVLVDELDASLHPALTATLVEMFKDPSLNRSGAQLVFTTHDTSLLDNSPTQLLESGEVWMCEKNDDGASELFSLADFTDLRRGSNKQHRYLIGAFGAVPRVDLSGLRRALIEDATEVEEP